MLKIDIISGFLGAGKTTFIKRLLRTNIKNEKVVLIENEFGQISVDSAFLADSGIEIKELSQGCICCSLVGDFSTSLKEVIEQFNPDRIIIEPSGVGKLSDVKKAIIKAELGEYLNSYICLVDVLRAKMYLKNFGEFFKDQVESASTVFFSRLDLGNEEKIQEALEIVREINENANIVTTYIEKLSDQDLFAAYENVDKKEIDKLLEEVLHDHEEHEHHHLHHHDEDECDDPDCCCHHHHHDGEDEEEHEHHHHHHHDDGEECDDSDCCCHHHHHDEDDEECEHHHHHHDGEECDDPNCSCHHHHHHHGHDADEIFDTFGVETVKTFDFNELKKMLDKLTNSEDYGLIVRAKGILNTNNGYKEININPGELYIEDTNAPLTGMFVVIGQNLKEEEIKNYFRG